ncbi:HGR007Wp [Eremothecium sinecaudum]|uniref:HGR007Wp n=1 Tax=Eremothecium sinecaudum TaxID=45286 RepID=A0A0X8HV76_9SACH|nr:HGR007Wp [Eremothecium sinecaudum]AMD22346.1 HGR007Wp [Eremothecium sinecaudum]
MFHSLKQLTYKAFTSRNFVTAETGGETSSEELLSKKYPAKAHNCTVKLNLKSRKTNLELEKTAVYIAGEALEPIKYSDQTKAFRQNRYFFYLSGCEIPSCSLLFDFKTDKLTLYLPNVDEESILWSGKPISLKEAAERYDVDEVLYESSIAKDLKALKNYAIYTTDTDNVKDRSIKKLLIEKDPDFFFALDEARMIKDDYEIALLRKACKITDNCHLAVMSSLPIEKNEMHLHAEFTYNAIRQGSKTQGYDPICCSGTNCSTLHYTKNDEPFADRRSVLIDAGAEWKNYTADVTRCFPINGQWEKEHLEIYETVLDMQLQVMKAIAPGVLWDTLHILAHKVLIERFLKLGIFKSSYSVEEILKRKASVAFFPHGLGHLLGLDTHDVGGQPNYDDPDPLLKYLRLRRALQKGMVVTNEPGCYFNKFLIERFLEQHPERLEVVDVKTMEKYMHIGGVRIEDDVLVTSTGHENLTKVTKDPDEIARIVQKGLSNGHRFVYNRS